MYPSFVIYCNYRIYIIFHLFFLNYRFEKYVVCNRVSLISEVSALPCNRNSVPLEYPSLPISWMTSGVVNKIPWASPRCYLFLLINIFSILSGSVIVSHCIVLDFGMLFQYVKSLGTYICLSLDFRFGFMWKLIDEWVFFLCSIAMICWITLPLEHFPSISNAIANSWRCCLRSDSDITMVSHNFFRVTVTYVIEWANVLILVS